MDIDRELMLACRIVKSIGTKAYAAEMMRGDADAKWYVARADELEQILERVLEDRRCE